MLVNALNHSNLNLFCFYEEYFFSKHSLLLVICSDDYL